MKNGILEANMLYFKKLTTVLFGSVLFLSGCETQKPVATNSLNDLLVEGRSARSGYLVQNEALSMAGTLPIPSAGAIYYFPNPHNPATILGLPANSKSYWQIGSVSPTSDITDADISQVKSALIEVQNKRANLVSDLVSQTASLAQSQSTNFTGNIQSTLISDVTTYQTQVIEDKKALAKALDQYHSTLKPGILVAEWTSSSQSGGGITISTNFQFSGAKAASRRGFIILGNIRFVSLSLGDDYINFYKNTIISNDFFRTLYGETSLATYLLQAKNLAYISENDVDSQVSASLQVYAKDFLGSAPAAKDILMSLNLKLAAYRAMDSQLVNSGQFGPVTWVRKELDYSKPIPESNEGYHTVYAVLSGAPKIYNYWNKHPPR